MRLTRVAALLAAVFGLLGLVGCTAGVFAVWRIQTRLERTNERVFTNLDQGLAAAQDRARRVQKSVQKSKITATELGQSLRARGDAAEKRPTSPLETENQVARLADGVQLAESWLAASIDLIQSLQQVLELASTAGAPWDAAALDDVLQKVLSIRSTLEQIEQTLGGVRGLASNKDGDGAPEGKRFSPLTQTLARVVVTIGEVDERLEEPINRLSELQSKSRQSKELTSHYILLAAIGSYLLLAWIGAGQAALCQCGRSMWRRSRSSPR